MIPIKHICSLGRNCHTAGLIKRNNWKKESYPFDWIFSNLKMITHCIEDDFKIFLDKDYYPDTSQDAWQQTHSYYHPFSDDKTFNHHNPLLDNDYQYFERCVDRFRKLFQTEDFKVFLHIVVNRDPINDMFKQSIIEFNTFLKTKTGNYALICICHSVGNKQSFKFDSHENIHFIDLQTISNSNGKEFIAKEDNQYLDNLLKQVYTFDIAPLK